MKNADTSLLIRPGHQDEATKLARLHVDVWRATYSGLAPSKAIELLDEAKRLPYWTHATSIAKPGRGVWVADEGGTLLGVVSLGSSSNSVFEGRAELKHLYVANGAQNRGLGEQLLQHAINECKAAGDFGMALAVVRQNERARGFYKKMGGVETCDFTDPGPLWRSENILVVWDF